MDLRARIEKARAVIGEQDEGDYAIAPTEHAEGIEEGAPELARLLRSSRVRSIARTYEEKDRRARENQRRFKTTATRANRAVFLTAALGALLLMTVPLSTFLGDGWTGLLQAGLGVGAIVAGTLGSVWLFEIRNGRLLERWMGARADAESRRLRYFERVIEVPSEQTDSSPVPLALFQLEYFRRYQLDVQRTYYRRRADEHERAADRILTLSAAAVGLASVATGLGGILGSGLRPEWISVAGLGVLASSLSTFALSQEGVGQDRRNMERYRRTLDALEHLAGKLDAVRRSTARGERAAFEQLAEAVHEQLSLEHRQWLKLSENVSGAIGRLETALAESEAAGGSDID